MAHVVAAEADGLARAGAVHDQARDPAPHQIGHAAQIPQFLGDVEAVEEHDARGAREVGVLGVDKVRGQAPAPAARRYPNRGP